MKHLALVWLALLALGYASDARAHYFGTGLLYLRERATAGRFALQLVPSTAMKRAERPPEFVYPAGCMREGLELVCAGAAFEGTLQARNLPRYAELIVHLEFRDGEEQTHVLTHARDHVTIRRGPRGASAVAAAYVKLGVEHLAGGLDHVLFVLALLLVVGFGRKLIWTITAFTAAHSLSLALGALGVVHLRVMPVETLIALSIVLVAAETIRQRETLTRRFPWLVAFGFGLVHGLGFSGAIQEVGLPRASFAVALLSFNVGVELGQLLLIALAFALTRAARGVRWRALAQGPAAMAYAIGAIATFWTVERLTDMLRGPS